MLLGFLGSILEEKAKDGDLGSRTQQLRERGPEPEHAQPLSAP